MSRGKLISLIGAMLVLVAVSYNNCSGKSSTPVGTIANPTPTPTATPNTSGGCVFDCPPPTTTSPTPLFIAEDFNSMFQSACNNQSNLSSCAGVIGATSTRNLQVKKFSETTCDTDAVTNWVGGQTAGRSPGYTPFDSTNMAIFRFANTHNEALLTKAKQSKTTGGIAFDFLAEGNDDNMITAITNLNFTSLCASTGKSSSVRGIYVGYANWGGGQVGFGVFVVGSSGSGFIAPSLIGTDKPLLSAGLKNDWYHLEFRRENDDYVLIVGRYVDSTKWAEEESVRFSASLVRGYNGSQEMPLGYVGLNSNQGNNVDFDNFNVQW